MLKGKVFRSDMLRAMCIWVFFVPQISVAETIELSSLTIKPNAPVSGNKSTGKVTASTPAPAGGVIVSLTSSNTKVATVPSSVEIPAGNQTVSFTIKTGAVTKTTAVTITARSADTKSATLTVNPDATVNWNGGPSPSFPVTNRCFMGDFNGDGKADLACYTGNAGTWTVSLSTGSGWRTQSWIGGPQPATPVTDQCFSGDFNGDGKTDLACYTGNAGSWNIALSTGSGWKSEFWNGGPLLVDEWNVVPVWGQCFAADFNHDHKVDLACSDGTDGVWSVALSTGKGWSTSSWSGGAVVPLPMTQQCVDGDFNGDGKADMACWTGEGGGWAVELSTGKGWNGAIWSGGPAPVDEWYIIPVGGQCFAADFSGDKKTDVVCSNGVDGNWSMSLSTGSGWQTTIWSGGAVVPLPMTQQCVDGDFNGDGKADMACWTGEGGGWAVELSTGKGWNGAIWSGGPVPAYEWNVIPIPGQCFTGDFNGDGITDVACYSGVGGTWAMGLSSGKSW